MASIVASRRARLGLLGAVAATLAATGFLLPPAISVVHPAAMALRDEAVGTGFVRAKALVGAGAKINGVILKTYVDQGDPVRKGQILAELQSTDTQSQLEGARTQFDAQRALLAASRSDLAAARARLDASVSALGKARAAAHLAELTHDRAQSLFASGVLSKDALDSAEAARDVAAHEVESADSLRAAAAQQLAAAQSGTSAVERGVAGSAAGVSLQRANVEYTIVRSPVDGYVVTRDLEEGATVVPGLPVFTVAGSDVVWVSASIDERELDGLRVGQPAAIALRSNQHRKILGTVARIGRQADPVTEEVIVDVAFQEVPVDVKLNETAEVTIRKGDKAQALALPMTAIVRGPEGPGVWIAGGGRLGRHAVTLGIRDKRGFAEVTRGLTSISLVVVNPSAAGVVLAEGRRVRAKLQTVPAR